MSGRPSSRPSARERGYTARWDWLRAAFLRSPLCVMWERDGRIVPATVVDHIVAHKGDQALMWSVDNLQPLCSTHHNSDKQREERGRAPQAIGNDGWPL